MSLSAISENPLFQRIGLILGIISSIITISSGMVLYFGGWVNMASLWSHGNDFVTTILFILAAINTVITLIVIYWGSIQTKKLQNDERDKLITPLYLALDSNRENPIKGAHLAFNEIRQYGYLAQPKLRNLLSQYCEIREENPKPEDMAPTYHLNRQRRLTDTIKQIFVLVENRYKELMWERKAS